MKLCILAISIVVISIVTIVFSNCGLKKTQIRHFYSQTQTFFVRHVPLHSGKLDDADIKYDNSFFNYQSKNTRIRQLWSKFYFFPIFKLWPKTTKLKHFCTKLKVFLFYMNLCIFADSMVSISNMEFFFQIPFQKSSKKATLISTLIFFFIINLSLLTNLK